MVRKPSLDTAYLQLARGREFGGELRRLCHEFCNDPANRAIIEAPGKVTIGPGESMDVGTIDSTNSLPVPQRIAMLTGDAAGSFRAALNYLTGQLAWLDSGKRQGGTQFLIEDAPAKFKGKRAKELRGIRDDHVAVIESLQPYSGCPWTGPLAKVSNVHKHDDLVVVTLWHRGRIDTTITPTESGPTHYHLKVRVRPELRVCVRDGLLPLIPTLELIEGQVTQTLDAFQSEFGRER